MEFRLHHGNVIRLHTGERILQSRPAYAIMPVGKRTTASIDAQKDEPPESIVSTSGGSPSFAEKSTVRAWLPTILPHQATCTGNRLLRWPIWREQRITICLSHDTPPFRTGIGAVTKALYHSCCDVATPLRKRGITYVIGTRKNLYNSRHLRPAGGPEGRTD